MSNGFEMFQTPEGLSLYRIPAFGAAGCTAVFTSRMGGSSLPPYGSLNLGYHVGDRQEAVIENRTRVCRAMNWNLTAVVCGEQVHSDTVAVVTAMDKGKGAFDYANSLSKTDALITESPDVVLATFYADCVPLFLFDPVKKVAALAHAGWKGTFSMIGPKTVNKMSKLYGTNPEDCLAAIGPSIGPCCYEVNDTLAGLFKEQHSWWEKVFSPAEPGKWYLNLWEANKIQLQAAGIREENIISSGICTSCNTDMFFSYRRENGCTGRMGAFMAIDS